MVHVALIQMTAGPDWASHRETATGMIRAAAAKGAQLIATPENTGGMCETVAACPSETEHPAVTELAALAHELGIWLLCGSVKVRAVAAGRCYNRSLLFDPAGRLAARYDKIHLFDVDLPGQPRYQESERVMPGGQAVVAPAAGACLGLSVCYDLRFAALYRALAQAGAQILMVPSAFTVPTGQVHWHSLLRARAIETGSFVLAPAQCGNHAGGRSTYGHSLIVDPWGTILAEGGAEPGIISASLDLARVDEMRRVLPSLHHDRSFVLPVACGPRADS